MVMVFLVLKGNFAVFSPKGNQLARWWGKYYRLVPQKDSQQCLINESMCRVCLRHSLALFLQKDGLNYLRCSHCQATLLAERQLPSHETQLQKYLQHENDPQDIRYREFLNRLAAPLLAALPPKQVGLDFGCGPGPALANMLSEAGHTMHLYDPFFFPDSAVLNQQFDFVTCTEVAEHFHQPHAEFTRLVALLKPGGLLALMTNFQTDDSRFADWHYRRDATHVTFYRQETFQIIAREFDLTCEIPCKNVVFLRKSVVCS
jgi:hypothetical protein